MRTLLLTLTIAAAASATAGAAVTDGVYATGKQKGAGTGVRISVEDGRFDVERIGFTERCESAGRSFKQPIRFERGTRASIAGKIRSDGRFSGRYEAQGTVFKVKGRFKGNHVNVVGSERGSYEDSSGETVRCEGRHRFKARRLGA